VHVGECGEQLIAQQRPDTINVLGLAPGAGGSLHLAGVTDQVESRPDFHCRAGSWSYIGHYRSHHNDGSAALTCWQQPAKASSNSSGPPHSASPRANAELPEHRDLVDDLPTAQPIPDEMATGSDPATTSVRSTLVRTSITGIARGRRHTCADQFVVHDRPVAASR
jgi:hypothetical protein